MDTATNTVWRVTPWNKGKLLGQKTPLKLKEIWAIRIRLQLDHRARELALFNLAIDSKLRGCDLVALRVNDVVQGSRIAPRAIVVQTKTQRPVQFEITEQTRDAIAAWTLISNRSSSSFRVAFRSRLICRPDSTLESSDRGLPRLD
jgi:site-specific recombinase XerC